MTSKAVRLAQSLSQRHSHWPKELINAYQTLLTLLDLHQVSHKDSDGPNELIYDYYTLISYTCTSLSSIFDILLDKYVNSKRLLSGFY